MTDHSLKALRADFKKQGKFYTPPELAEFLKSLIPGQPTEVYDPTCGAGNLLAVFDDQVVKYGQDVDPEAVNYARNNLTNFHGIAGDVLTTPGFTDRTFPAIVANPPFSIKWEPPADKNTDPRFESAPTIPTKGRADFAFLLHILAMLNDDGTAAVLNFPGICYRGQREATLRRWMIETNVVDQVIQIPGDTFTDTAIATVCLVLKKTRDTDSIRFVDQEHDLSCDVLINEIKDNDYSLAVNTYIQQEIVKEVVDPVALELAARRHFIRELRKNLHMSQWSAQMESELELADFIQEIDQVLDEYRPAVDLTDKIEALT